MLVVCACLIYLPRCLHAPTGLGPLCVCTHCTNETHRTQTHNVTLALIHQQRTALRRDATCQNKSAIKLHLDATLRTKCSFHLVLRSGYRWQRNQSIFRSKTFECSKSGKMGAVYYIRKLNLYEKVVAENRSSRRRAIRLKKKNLNRKTKNETP